MQVWTYPEKRMEEFGAERWNVEWYTLRANAPEEDWDPVEDIVTHHIYTKTRAEALRRAKGVVSECIFGQATIQRQCVDWYVEEDRVAEWTDVGDSEEVSAWAP